jgi:hypothetical protein
VGNHATFGEEVVASGIYDKASFSIGQYYFKTNGFRDNNDLKDNIFNAFLQYNLFPETSVQGEFRYRDFKAGDLGQRFLPDDFAPRLRDHDERSSVRLGFHQTLWPGSDLIGNFMYQHQDYKSHDFPDPVLIYSNENYDADAVSAELQHLFRWKFIKTILGVGYFNIDSKDQNLWVINFPPPTPMPGLLKRDIDHTNLYLYSYINYPKNVTITVGASGDFLQGGDKDTNQFNPKFGITWDPFPGTTLRGAVFRTLKRTLITNQTLEPTQVAGFNQFFDDWNGTKAWNYGGAIDQKFFKSLYGGGEFSYRDLKVPYVDYSSLGNPVREADWKEYLGRAYLYWTPYKWFGLSAEYLFERFKRDREFTLGVKEVETQRVPLGINFFHPCGLSAMFKASYVNQHGSFDRQYPFPTGTFTRGEDKFWLFDTAISYRLPKRYGFISFGVKNLLNKHFNFFDPDYFNPSIQPGRFIYGRVTLSLP